MSTRIEGGSPNSSEELTVILETGWDFIWIRQPDGSYVNVGNDALTVVSKEGIVTFTTATDVNIGDRMFSHNSKLPSFAV